MRTAQGHKGFTLVEMAIVLVIIGLILGAVLKGQELIGNAKVKKLQQQYINGLDGFIWGFYDRQGRFPGDCNKNGLIGYRLPPNSAPGTYNPPALSANQNPTTDYCASTSTGENQNTPFSDLRSQGFLPANVTNQDLATFTGFGMNTQVRIGTANTTSNAIVIYNIPSFAAQMIDTSIDTQPNATSGRFQRWDSAAAWPATKDQAVHVVYYFDRQP